MEKALCQDCLAPRKDLRQEEAKKRGTKVNVMATHILQKTSGDPSIGRYETNSQKYLEKITL